MTIVDHVSVGVSDLGKARTFYDAVLGALGYARVYDFEMPEQNVFISGYGYPGKAANFWIGVPEKLDASANARGGAHAAFAADDRAKVDAFYKAALAAGAKDNGAPGLRPHYHADYYGAFVIDPDGNKIEACCHSPG